MGQGANPVVLQLGEGISEISRRNLDELLAGSQVCL